MMSVWCIHIHSQIDSLACIVALHWFLLSRLLDVESRKQMFTKT